MTTEAPTTAEPTDVSAPGSEPVPPDRSMDVTLDEARAVMAIDDPTGGAGPRLGAAIDWPEAVALFGPGADPSVLRNPAFDLQSTVLVSVTVPSSACGVRFDGFDATADRVLTPRFEPAASAGPAGCADQTTSTTFVLAVDREAVAPSFVLADPQGPEQLTVEVEPVGPDPAGVLAVLHPTIPIGTVTDPPEAPTLLVDPAKAALELAASTSCWMQRSEGHVVASFCADGFPSRPLPHAGEFDGPVRIAFPLPGWTFGANMGPEDRSSGGPASVHPIAPGQWEVDPTGRAGASEVHLYGRGPQGDVAMSFALDLLVDGVEPPPESRLIAFNPDPDAPGGLRTWGFDLIAVFLADDRSPAAAVTVTAGDGAQRRVEMGPHQDGVDPEGDGAVVFQLDPATAQELLALGPAPYTVEVELVLGGTTHRATATFPDDHVASLSGAPLTFDPPLPGR